MKSTQLPIVLSVQAILLALFIPLASGQSTAFTYQGRLNDGATPVNGTFDLRFDLYDIATPVTAPLGSLTRSGVGVTGGVFTVTLDFGQAAFSGPARWLQVSVRTNGGASFVPLSPLQPFTSAPYAITAGHVTGPVPAAQVSGFLPAGALGPVYSSPVSFTNVLNQFIGDGSLLHFDGYDYCNLPCYWRLRGNAGTVPGLNFVGTTDRHALQLHVNSERAFRLEPTTNSPNVIGGFQGNFVETNVVGATIGGGGTGAEVNSMRIVGASFGNLNLPHFGTISGGAGNVIRGSHFGTIGGGIENQIVESFELAAGMDFNTVSGGISNRIDLSQGCSIGGGMFNFVEGDTGDRVYYSTIGGGAWNTIDSIDDSVRGSVIAGGVSNSLDRANGSTISGGRRNAMGPMSDAAIIAGGEDNYISANARWATISGGLSNSINAHLRGATIGGGSANSVLSLDVPATYATITGGQSNLVSGPYGTVLSGRGNEAGEEALAAGTQAKALHRGSSVWATGNAVDYPSAADNRVHFYAPGGVEVEYAGQNPATGRGLKWLILASPTPGRVIEVYNGAYLSDGGAWTDTSDRDAKENFEPVDPKEILERVAALPVTRWNYRSEDETVQHLGPVAQDFHEAFGLGADDKHIAGLDSGGVALAAIQGLNLKLQEKQEEVVQLKQRLEALEKKLNAVLAAQPAER